MSDLPPPTLGSRCFPQPRRPGPYWTEDYTAGYEAGYYDGRRSMSNETSKWLGARRP